MAGLESGSRISICGSGGKVARALATEFKKRGFDAQASPEAGSDASTVIFMALPVGAVDVNAASELSLSAFRAARSIAPKFSAGPGRFVVVQSTGGSFGFRGTGDQGAAWLGGLAGLVKTAGLEWPDSSVKSIDLETTGLTPAECAVRIADELLLGGPEIEVGLTRDGGRNTIGVRQTEAQPGGELILPENAVVLVSGGGRGVTAAVVKELAAARKLRWVLIGRTPLGEEPASLAGMRDAASLRRALIAESRNVKPSRTPAEIERTVDRILAAREIRETLADLQSAGSAARYVQADISDAANLSQELEKVRLAWGPISGVIHGAGVLADKRIQDKTDAQFESVWKVKVDGLAALLESTSRDPIKLLCLFSSVAGRGGNPGQCDYAMANEVLNKVAQAEAARRGNACVVKSINWGPWDGGMVDGALKGHFEKLGVSLIPLREGAQFLKAELSGTPASAVEVVAGAGLHAPQRKSTMQVHVSAKSHPFLLDHQISGRPVLPMVMAAEWFLRAGRALLPGQECRSLNNLRVLRTGVLQKLADDGEKMVVNAAASRNSTGQEQLDLELVSNGGHRLYQATLESGAGVLIPNHNHVQPVPAGSKTVGPLESFYPGKLFHGPAFHVVRTVDRISPEGGSGTLTGTLSKNWQGGPWLSDAALLDGGLQLVLVWGIQQAGRLFVPTRIGGLRSCSPVAADQIVRCEFLVKTSGNRLSADINFTDSKGGLMAFLHDVELFTVESGETSGLAV